MKRILSHRIVGFFLVLLVVFMPLYVAAKDNDTVNRGRNKLIGSMLRNHLPAIHYSDKKMDDILSLAAFELYLKQLDFQKRFLLSDDVLQLRAFASHIDNELARGNIVLPRAGAEMLDQRIGQVEKMVIDIMASDLEVKKDEEYETDVEKLAYAKDLAGLRDRWRKILKGQIISRFLDLEEDQKDEKEKKTEAELFQEAKEKVAKRNRNFFHRLRQETLQDHFDRYFNAVTRSFDPHTNYMAPAGKEDFDIHMRGSLEGIGALLREEDGYIKVIRIIPGSASARQGILEAEDIILQVAQNGDDPVEITDMRLREAVRLIRGPKGTEVRLTVKKTDGLKQVIPIIRDVVQIEETFVKTGVLDGPGGSKIGYIMIPSFYRDFEKTRNGDNARNSTTDTKKALLELKDKNIQGLILDLRDNGGGSLMDAVDVTGLFIEQGPVVQVQDSYGSKRILDDDDPSIVYNGPVVVLVNQFSASASEIVAAALQDYQRAVIVGGAHTHGKGTVQTVVNMNDHVPFLSLRRYPDLGALKVTIQKFYRVNGGSTQYKGVEPDIVLPSLFQHLKSGEQYMDNSLPWGQVAAVPFQSWNNGSLNVQNLMSKSLVRTINNKALQTMAKEAERAKVRNEKTILSLQIDDMRAKRIEAREARKKLGRHYSKYKEDENEDKEAKNNNKSPDELYKEWFEGVREDPYVEEAERILIDMGA